jgi:Tol biopolymer transport system component
MRRWVLGVRIAAAVALTLSLDLAATMPTRASVGAATTVVSVTTGGVVGDGHSSASAISADGRYVAFSSAADDLVAGDTNAARDVFVRDLRTGETTRVSVDTAGTQGNAESGHPAISADGRFVAFESSASNLVGGDTNGTSDIFVRDLVASQTTRASVGSARNQGNGDSAFPSISADGRRIAFESWASDLVTGDTNGVSDIFIRDVEAGTTRRVSVDSSGREGNGYSEAPAISADGRFVAFGSDASNLVAGDTNRTCDVFVRDLQTSATSRVSIGSAGQEGAGPSSFPSISGDGRRVAFESSASGLAPGPPARVQVLVRDRVSGETTRASVGTTGQAAGGYYGHPAISATGRFVAFDSAASDLVAGDTNGSCDVFLRDLQARTTERISIDSAARAGSGDSWDPAISSDGGSVAFDSIASDLVAGDGNGCKDVFIHVFPDTTPPSPPSSLRATPGIEEVSLSWTNPAFDFAATRILRSTTGFATSPTQTVSQTQIADGMMTSTTDTGRTPGLTCYYSAYSRDAAGNYSAAATASATPLERPRKANLSRPRIAPTTPRLRQYFYVRGTLDRHASPALVRLYFYRKVGKTWRLHGNRRAWSYPAIGYRLRYRVAHRGEWRVLCCHGDADHLETRSDIGHFRVR